MSWIHADEIQQLERMDAESTLYSGPFDMRKSHVGVS